MDKETLQQFSTLLRSGKAGECRVLAERKLQENGDNFLALAYRGIARGLLGEKQDGTADLRNAADGAATQQNRSVEAFARHYLGNALVEAREPAAGLEALERAAELGLDGPDILTALCQAANAAGNEKKARKWGERALLAKDAQVDCPAEQRVARKRPKPFDPEAKSRNIIAYSLFGDDPYYCQCALTNARQLPFIYPEFTARFYCSSTIPERVVQELALTGADVRVSNNTKAPKFAGLFWRFLPFDEMDVDCVLVRDVDSPVLPRERAAIDKWLSSEFPFHVLRDNIQHTAPILAGLWGGFTGLLPRLGPLIDSHVKRDATRYSDQNFLRQFVWPRIRDATLAIDSTYSLHHTVDYPPGFDKVGVVHVGVGWPRKSMAVPGRKQMDEMQRARRN